ncbi:hypothetical protein Bbelb_082730 [Branchiostoma belcheri]|nr:hypothetical protein Bbelb_082730 [Branchiostoma belcheri]
MGHPWKLMYTAGTRNTVSDKELEVLRILHPLFVASENNGGDKGGTTDMYNGDADADTDGEIEGTEGTDLVTEDADGDTKGNDEDTEGTDGVTGDTDEDTGGTDGDTGDTDGDTEGTDEDTGDTDGDTEGAAGDTGDTDGDTDGSKGDTADADRDTGDANGDTEGTDGDTGDGNGDTDATDGDTQGTNGVTGDAAGDNEGTDGDTEDDDGDTEGTDGDTKGTDGDTGKANGDTKGTANGDTGDADEDTRDANGDTEGTDEDTGDTDGDTEGTDGDTGDGEGDTEGTDGDTQGTDGVTGDAAGDNEGTDGDTEDDAGDNEGTDGDTEGTDGDTGNANGDTEGTDGDTGDANGDTGNANGDNEGTDRDIGDDDVSSTRATEKRGQDAEDLESLTRGRGAGDDELAFQGRRQNSEPLEVCTHHPYLGILISQDLKWSTHINTLTSKANSTLGFLRRNVRGASREERRKLARLVLFYKAVNSLIAIPVQEYLTKNTNPTRGHSLRYTTLTCKTDTYRASFFPRTVAPAPHQAAYAVQLNVRPHEGVVQKLIDVDESCRYFNAYTTTPSTHRCGTHGPVWMNGQHPSVADGEVSRQVCGYWSGNPCVWSKTIQVKACSAGYYVYKLPGVQSCHYAYCGASVNFDACEAFSPCENGDCVNGDNEVTCNCGSGYEGERCERDIDGCSPNPCDAEATCADVAAPGTGANCTCPSGFWYITGLRNGRPGFDSGSYPNKSEHAPRRCTLGKVVPVDSEKIIFPGPRDVDDYARMETTLSEDLTSFTLCVHMRSNMASNKQISLLHIQRTIQGVRMADPPVWDGEWHTICTTWENSDGVWQLYADGDLTTSGSGFRVGERVRRGGTWILGQDQDRVGGGFEASQSFIGELSKVNLWDRVLSPAEIAADCSYHGNVIDWDTTDIRVLGEASRAEYHRCPSTTCSNDYMELSIPEDQLTDIDLNNLHWRPDRNCGATTNGSHYLFRTELYDCGTEVTFGPKYVTFLNRIHILGTHRNSGVITREGDIWITSRAQRRATVSIELGTSRFRVQRSNRCATDATTACNYERKEWVDATFLPIPGGLNFTEEGFGQLEVRLSMFATRQYQRQYRADQYPIHLRLRQHVYMQLEVQGHGQKLSVLALNCKATMSPSPNDSLQYQLIRDGCASDPTLKTYDVDDPGKERFGFEAFRFIREVRTVYVHCEVLVCDAADSGSRCAQGCVRRGKRAAGEVDMRGRHMIYQGPIVLDDDEEAEHDVRLVDDQETGPARRGAPWAMLAAGCVLTALALVVLGAAIVQKRSRRGEWAYHGLKDGE